MNNDPVNQALLRLYHFLGPPGRQLAGVPLSDAQYDDYAHTAGTMAKIRLDALVNQPDFAQLPRGVATRAIDGIMETSRHAAGELTKMRHPELISQAMQTRRDMVVNGRSGR